MSATIDALKRRKIQIYEIKAEPELVRVTVEAEDHGETRVGVTVALGVHSAALDSSELEVALLGSGHFNPIAFPGPGALPEIRVGGRAAAATFKFEPVEPHSSAHGLELRLRGRGYHISFQSRTGQPKADGIPESVANLLPQSWSTKMPR
jgi:hypothetical protein